MAKKMTKRRRQAAETKARIMRCALTLIMEKGYENIKISDICQAAGVSNGNFYHYFTSKDDVLLFTYRGFDEFVENEFSKLRFDSATEAIISLLHEQVVGVHAIGAKLEAQTLQAQLRLQGGYVTSEGRPFPRHLCELVEKAIEAGEIHPSHDPEEVTRTLLQTSRGIMFDWALRGGSYSPEVQTLRVLRLLFSGLREPREPDGTPYRCVRGGFKKDELV